MTRPKLTWREEEVIAYLEYMIMRDEATDVELELYEDYKWNDDGGLNKDSYAYRLVIHRMKMEWDGE